MKLSKIGLTLIVAAAVATPALRTSAAGSGKDSGPYLTFDGGVNFLQDANLAYADGTTGKAKFDTGFRVGLIGGYNLNSWAAVELETGFLYNSIQDSGDAWLGTVPILGNIVLRYENDSKFVPYIGAGAGGAYTTVQGGDTSESDFVFAYQGKVGVAYEISANMAVDVGYKFLGTADQTYGDTKVKDIYNHYIGLSFTWKF